MSKITRMFACLGEGSLGMETPQLDTIEFGRNDVMMKLDWKWLDSRTLGIRFEDKQLGARDCHDEIGIKWDFDGLFAKRASFSPGRPGTRRDPRLDRQASNHELGMAEEMQRSSIGSVSKPKVKKEPPRVQPSPAWVCVYAAL